MQDKIIVGLIGIITGFLGALLKSWLDTRLKLDVDTRKERWEVYKLLWELTKRVPKWPRDQELTYEMLLKFSEGCRDWYFQRGGFHLSRPAQRAYANMQDTVTAALKSKNPAANVDDGDYDLIQKSCSAMRTQLTLDLHSRQRGAFHLFGV